MMVDRHFLCRWCIGRHSISRLTEAVGSQLQNFARLQVRGYIYTLGC